MRTLLSLLLLSLAPAAQTPLPLRPALLPYGSDLSLRDRYIANEKAHADLGGWLLVSVRKASPRLPGLRVLPALRAGEGIALLGGSGPEIPSGARLLADTGAFRLLAGPRNRLAALSGEGFHGSLQLLDLGRRYIPAHFEAPQLPMAPDPRIQAMVAKVSTANIRNHIKNLSAIWTRNARTSTNAKAISYLKTELAKIKGLTVVTHTFSRSYGPNLIAEIKGRGASASEIVMLGSHLDSYVWGGYSKRAPGADDNASGTAAVLELARVMAAIPWKRTVRFGFWNAEEFGLVGSRYYAPAAKARGDKIRAYINLDMTCYRASGDTTDVDFVLNDSTPSLISTMISTGKVYVPTLGVKKGYLYGGTSDHRSFFRNGFPACFPFEDLDKYSRYIHSANDVLGTSANDLNLATLITRFAGAGAATLAGPLDPPAFTIYPTSGPTLGGTAVIAGGAGLDAATRVTVGGRTVPFRKVPGGIAFSTPTSSVLGAAAVEIFNPAGSGKAAFTFTPTSPPALRVVSPVPIGGNTLLAIGGKPAGIEVTFLSPRSGTTDLGLVKLDIGGGSPSALFFFHAALLSKGGGTVEVPFQVPNLASLKGKTFYFQAALPSSDLKTVGKTNSAALLLQ